MKKAGLIFLLFALQVHLPVHADSEKSSLSQKYKEWIETAVVYIITPKEKDAFYKLESDRERELFIEEFWLRRDPTPSTFMNEFKEEHYKRIEYANKFFSRGTPLPGWKTDRGKIYIMLGEAAQIARFNSGQIFPAEIWYYQGNPRYGQPPLLMDST